MFKQIHRTNTNNPGPLITNRQTHTYSTRQASNFHRNYARTQKVKNSFIFGGPQLWDNLPNDLKTIPTERYFQQQMKRYLLNCYI